MNQRQRERLFVELFDGNRARILRLCYGYLGSDQEVEDLFQEIMANVWRSLPGFREDAKPTTWLYRIAVNTALLYRKRLNRRETGIEAIEGGLADTAALPDAQHDASERLHALRRAIAELPGQDRLIVGLLLEGLSYKEIAEVTGITVNYAGVKISRIKQALEKSMREPNHARA